MMLKQFNLQDYLFGEGIEALSTQAQGEIENKLRNEMKEIFYGMNMGAEWSVNSRNVDAVLSVFLLRMI